MSDHGVKFPDSPPKAGAGTINKGFPKTGSSRGNAATFTPGRTVAWPDKAQGKIHKSL